MQKIARRKKSNANIPLFICLGAIIAMVIKIFALDFYIVKGFSMEPSVKNGQTIAANKLFYGLQNPFKPELAVSWNEPKAGEVVLYMYQNYWVVKRCVATGGTELRCKQEGEDYFLFVGKEKIPLTSIQYHKLKTSQKIPQGYILAIGDNSAISHDSRDYGFVPVKNIVARVH